MNSVFTFITFAGPARRMVHHADSGRDSGIRQHSFAGLCLLVFAIEKAYKPIPGSCERPGRIAFADFNCSSNHGFQSHGNLCP